jgi:Ca2+-binding RTX toxin-like protein
LIGGNGIDTLDGGWGNDILTGGSGNDTLTGRSGNDTLRGGLGNDVIRADGGDLDIVVLAQGEGTDRIESFNVGSDRIGLADGLTFGDLSFNDNNINAGAEILAILEGIDTTTLNASNFVIL